MSFEKLVVWQRSSRLCVDIYKCLCGCRDFTFKDQLCRSALSVPSNIAEGVERSSFKERKHFLSIAKGSSAECRTQVYIGIEVGYIDQTAGKRWIQELKEISAMIQGLIKSWQ
ncbi:four helix bundle protein [Endozoicomonas acroporae]|uniref:four helix bundle protein n=1 Tax=Endozoicomonas acroporae TaxID=1701104 RepID=UPI003D7B3FFD